MDISSKILSSITVFGKYSKYLPEKQRRESWEEICDRLENMFIEKYPSLKDDIVRNLLLVREKKVLPSMRAMQFAGPAIRKNNSRIYNCAFLPIDDYASFAEVMFLLLGGTGVGYSVQRHQVAKLPAIKKPTKERRFLVGDSLEGWADCIKVLMKAYFGISNHKPVFDFSDIRPKGARLITAGGKAPGPEPLRICVAHVESILERKEDGEQLTPLECHDICCHIANAVLSGGIRRSAMISLFSHDDEDMLTCKYGNWWELNEQRGRSNNSAVLDRAEITRDQFFSLWKKIELSGSGEPGMYFTNDKDWGTNPCCEIALRPYQFCNLCEVNVSDVESQEELNKRVAAAAFLGTLQAGFTDFHYLREVWKQTTEKDALIGVGMTGIASGKILKLNLNEASEVAKQINEDVANTIGINAAARVTTIKPSGTTSCVLGTSSGIHAWHAPYYIRRIRLGKNEALYTYLSIRHPELLEDDFFRPKQQGIVSIPQKAPEGSIIRTESAIDLLERVKKFNLDWVQAGHRDGANTNNVSATISIDKTRMYNNGDHEIDEWYKAGLWMWDNRHTFNGLSVLPADNGNYVQAPFTDCTAQEYERLMNSLSEVDLTQVVELEDDTDLSGELACAGGNCEIK